MPPKEVTEEKSPIEEQKSIEVLEEDKKNNEKSPEKVEILSSIEDSVNKIAISEEEILYTIKQTSKSTLRRLNDILMFLEEEKNIDAYGSQKKNLKICNKNGVSLLVSDIKIPSDAFISLARYFGI
jgi:hypothetical protein